MPNPADDFQTITKNSGPAQNRKGIEQVVKQLEFIKSHFRRNAIIKSVDTGKAGVYTVDIYDTYDQSPKYIDIEAVTIDSPMEYIIDTPCEVIYHTNGNGQALIVRPTKFFCFKITDDEYDEANSSNFVTGIVCNPLGDTVLEAHLPLDLSYPYPNNQVMNSTTRIPDPDDIVWVMIYDQFLTYGADNSIAETKSIGLIISNNINTLPIGEFQWQGFMNITSAQTGFEWDRVHGLPNNA